MAERLPASESTLLHFTPNLLAGTGPATHVRHPTVGIVSPLMTKVRSASGELLFKVGFFAGFSQPRCLCRNIKQRQPCSGPKGVPHFYCFEIAIRVACHIRYRITNFANL